MAPYWHRFSENFATCIRLFFPLPYFSFLYWEVWTFLGLIRRLKLFHFCQQIEPIDEFCSQEQRNSPKLYPLFPDSKQKEANRRLYLRLVIIQYDAIKNYCMTLNSYAVERDSWITFSLSNLDILQQTSFKSFLSLVLTKIWVVCVNYAKRFFKTLENLKSFF